MTKSYENINIIDKLLARLTKKKKRWLWEIKSHERGEITIDTTEILRAIREYYEQLYTNKMDNLGEMNKYLESHNFSKLT